MTALLGFTLAFVFSFVGSIPPGSLNLSILQLGLDHKMRVAWRFAIAAALIEYPYAWLAVFFEDVITSNLILLEHFQLIAALVMIALGVINLWSSRRPQSFIHRFNESGFRRGIVLSVLNPLAMPFWIAVTAYLKSQHLITLTSAINLHLYLAGVSLGALALLMVVAYSAKKVAGEFTQGKFLKSLPGLMLLGFGIFSLIQYLV